MILDTALSGLHEVKVQVGEIGESLSWLLQRLDDLALRPRPVDRVDLDDLRADLRNVLTALDGVYGKFTSELAEAAEARDEIVRDLLEVRTVQTSIQAQIARAFALAATERRPS